MSHLNVSEPSKEERTALTKNPRNLIVNKTKRKKGIHCHCCGSSGHLGRDPKCPARGQTCGKCKGKDQFASICKTKPKKPGVNRVQEDLEANGEQVDYAFTNEVHSNHSNLLMLSVGGVELEMLVDSGATINIVDEETWEDSKAKKIKCKSEAASLDVPILFLPQMGRYFSLHQNYSVWATALIIALVINARFSHLSSTHVFLDLFPGSCS